MAQLRNLLFYGLTAALLVLVSMLAERSAWEIDFAQYGGNRPAAATIALLDNLEHTVSITAYLAEHPVQRKQISDLVARLRGHGAAIELNFVDPAREPDKTRDAGVRKAGTLRITYAGRSEKVEIASEVRIADALLRLSRQGAPWIIVLTGHGERRFTGAAPSDLGLFGALLERRGYRLLDLSLADTPQLPDNAALVILAAPATDLTPAELDGLDGWLAAGGSLLWLAETARPQLLAQRFGIKQLPGTIVDAMAANLGFDTPEVAVAARHPNHPVTARLDAPVVVPHARGWLVEENDQWRAETLLRSSPQSWNETGPLTGRIKREAERGEQAGPIALGVALTRTGPNGPQRVAVLGDADLFSDAVLGQQANRAFGLALVHWLTAESQLLEVLPNQALDVRLQWSARTATLVVAILMIFVPGLLVGLGLGIRYRRMGR